MRPLSGLRAVLKQRMQVGNDLYDLEDIYGMPAEVATDCGPAADRWVFHTYPL